MFYTYRIGWKEKNKWYYGVRYSKKAKTEDVGSTYFSSSNCVKEFIKENGLPDIVEIRKVFKTKKEALDWESRVLRRLGIPNNEKYLNKWNNNIIPFKEEGSYPFEFVDVQNKVNQTFKKLYGGKGSGSNFIKNKVFDTNIKKYGIHHTLNLKKVKNAREKRCLQKYGTINPFFSKQFHKQLINPMLVPEHKEKHKKSMENKDWSERNKKTKETNIKKYGISNPMNTFEIREKHKQQCAYCNRIFNAGGFSLHMKKIHNWSNQQIKSYKDENKKNSD